MSYDTWKTETPPDTGICWACDKKDCVCEINAIKKSTLNYLKKLVEEDKKGLELLRVEINICLDKGEFGIAKDFIDLLEKKQNKKIFNYS